MSKLDQQIAENLGGMNCLNSLIEYIHQVKEGAGSPPTALEINEFFIKPKIKEYSDKIEQLSREAYKPLEV